MQEVTGLKKKLIAAGHICLDITPIFPEKRVTSPGDILAPGKLINVKEADVHTGGSVANTGLAMKILGADVMLMGMVGEDAFGDMVKSLLEEHDVECRLLVAKGASTSYSVILAIPGIDRIFLHNSGANNHFYAGDVPREALEEAGIFHFGYPPVMRSMYENDGEELVRLMKLAGECGAASSLDFTSIEPDSEAGRADWNRILKRVIPYVDFLVPSVEELCYMLDRERYQEWQERAAGRDITEVLDVEQDIRPLADMCMAYGARVLLIKCGAPGMYYRTANADRLQKLCSQLELSVEQWADKEGFEESYEPDKVLSGTGAGDTSIAAFLTAVLKGYSPEDAVHLAAAAGASCVEAYDALSGLKSFEELEAKIQAGWKKRRNHKC